MKTTINIMSVVSIVLMIFTIICGLWIKTQGAKPTDIQSSVTFHMVLAIGTILFTVLTLLLSVLRK